MYSLSIDISLFILIHSIHHIVWDPYIILLALHSPCLPEHEHKSFLLRLREHEHKFYRLLPIDVAVARLIKKQCRSRSPSPGPLAAAFSNAAAPHSRCFTRRASTQRRPQHPPRPSWKERHGRPVPTLCACTPIHLLSSARRRHYVLSDSGVFSYVASLCFKCFRYMLRVFYINILKVDRNVAYVEMVAYVCCKCLLPMF
jgi:hypothetical protein